MRGLVRTILTTNFDPCLPDALRARHPHIKHIAEVNRGPEDYGEFDVFNKCQIVWLHGKAEQYSDKNSRGEIGSLDDSLIQLLRPLLKASPVIVIGYRGSEPSIMEGLFGQSDAGRLDFRNGIYWCTRGGEEPHPKVLELAQRLSSNFTFVEIEGFDEVLGDAAKQLIGRDRFSETLAHSDVGQRSFDERICLEATLDDLDMDLALVSLTTYCEQLRRSPLTWAQRYHRNDVLLYSRSSKETGLEKGEYARVKSIDASNNLLTVMRADGTEQTYDPRRQQGVSVYRTEEKAFSVGDRIQFTAPANDLKVANRELGTVQSITDDGRIGLKMDDGRSVRIDPREYPHLDHGYAVTSHSSQGQTADRVLINIDTELGAKDLLNNRMAYVAVSRGAQDAQIFTNNRQQLPQALGRDVSHSSAHVPEMKQEAIAEPKRGIEPAEKIYTRAEHERHWTPLNNALMPQEAAQFGWQAESGDIQSYRHNDIGRHINIQGGTGQFYDQSRNEISAKKAMDHAMPTGQGHSYSLTVQREQVIDRGHGLGR